MYSNGCRTPLPDRAGGLEPRGRLRTRVFVLAVAMALFALVTACAWDPKRMTRQQYVAHWPYAPKSVRISGLDAEAITIAVRDWTSNVSHGKFLLRDQEITVDGATRGLVNVGFLPRPDGSLSLGGATKYGAEVHYVIDPIRGRIVSRLFSE